MGEAQPIIPLLVMWQRTLRIRQCMRQELVAADAQDLTTQQLQYPMTGEQALFLLCEQAQVQTEETGDEDTHLWWEEFAQETDWAQWQDQENWRDWNKS